MKQKLTPKKELYFSLDIEADGPYPGDYSMLSLGCVAFDDSGAELGEWYANFELLPGAGQDLGTMKFWADNQSYYDLTRTFVQSPQEAMTHFVEWVESFDGSPVAVAMPAGFDWTFLYYYLIKFAGRSPFSFSCLDVKTMAMCLLNLPYRDSVKRNWKKEWFSKLPHTHHALEDAREAGQTFVNMLKDLRSRS